MNELDPNVITGTIGELLVQLRLLQYGVQATPPLKDSGNDLIGVRGSTFKAIQVKTTTAAGRNWGRPADRLYHILALVRLHIENNELLLDQTDIFLLDREMVDSGNFNFEAQRISQEVVDQLIPDQN